METLERYQWDSDNPPTSYEVEVRFVHASYIYLLTTLYNSEKGIIKDGGLKVSVFELVPRIKLITEQLRIDGYVEIFSQKCSFYSEQKDTLSFHEDYLLAKEYENQTGEVYEKYIDAEKQFLKEELKALESAVILTTKGHGSWTYFIEKLLSEPIGSISLIISISAFLVSIFLDGSI